MFQFPGCPPSTYGFSCWCLDITPDGFPHSDILGSIPACGSPRLFAACHVLLRRMVPWHPPCALISLIFSSLDPETNCSLLSSYVLLPLRSLSLALARSASASRLLRFATGLFLNHFLSLCSCQGAAFSFCFPFGYSLEKSVFVSCSRMFRTLKTIQAISQTLPKQQFLDALCVSLALLLEYACSPFVLFALTRLFAGLPAIFQQLSVSACFRSLCSFSVDRPRFSFRISASAFSLERR